MTIRQGTNGWMLKYTGHDCLDREKVFSEWKDVLQDIEEFFGWWDRIDGKWVKKNPYSF